MVSQKILLPALLLAAHAAAFAADPVRANFEGLTVDVGGFRDDVAVGDFYNGGSSRQIGTGAPLVVGPLPSLGIAFDGNALVTETAAGGNGGASGAFGLTRDLVLENGTLLPGSSALGVGVLYAPADTFELAFAAGFNDGLSFFFNANSDLQVSVLTTSGWSADVTFSSTGLCAGSEPRCRWVAASLPFGGTAFGVRFSGNDFALDNITLGQFDPYGPLITGGDGVTPIPEPSTYALMALGLGLVTWIARRRRPREA